MRIAPNLYLEVLLDVEIWDLEDYIKILRDTAREPDRLEPIIKSINGSERA